MTPFTQYKPWMVQRHGEALFRVPIQLSTSCPHGRCAFCSENGARAQQTQRQLSVIDQIEAAIKFSKRRYKAQKLMLYIQAFTADMTHPEQQQTLIECLEKYPFEAISIGTRPDCLPEKALHFLEQLKERVEVWVELGVQTANDQTLETIHRGHDWNCSQQAIHALSTRGIHVAPHIILGLPGETSADWIRTAEELAKLPIAGIKIHNLHIMRGTELADLYHAKPFPVLNHWEYAEGLIDFIRRVPADIPVMRISTDTPTDQLIAPHWHLEKGQFLDYVIQQMTMRDIQQGDLCGSGIPAAGQRLEASSTIPVQTDDGSITFFSEDWKEHYHTKTGARLEADKKFIEPSGLNLRLQKGDVQILDVCFGLGNNSLAALSASNGSDHSIQITALEMDQRIVRAASKNFQGLKTDPANWQDVLNELLDHSTSDIDHSSLALNWGDARYLIQSIPDHSIDLIFHDPFSTQHCPELWSVEFFKQLHRVMKSDGSLLTYSNAAPVCGAMREAGFMISATEPGHQMGNGTIAAKQNDILSNFKPVEELDPRRSTPYRDEFLCATSKAILRQRQETVESM